MGKALEALRLLSIWSRRAAPCYRKASRRKKRDPREKEDAEAMSSTSLLACDAPTERASHVREPSRYRSDPQKYKLLAALTFVAASPPALPCPEFRAVTQGRAL